MVGVYYVAVSIYINHCADNPIKFTAHSVAYVKFLTADNLMDYDKE